MDHTNAHWDDVEQFYLSMGLFDDDDPSPISNTELRAIGREMAAFVGLLRKHPLPKLIVPLTSHLEFILFLPGRYSPTATWVSSGVVSTCLRSDYLQNIVADSKQEHALDQAVSKIAADAFALQNTWDVESRHSFEKIANILDEHVLRKAAAQLGTKTEAESEFLVY